MNKILSTRYKITDELRCIRFFHFLHDVILLSVFLVPSEYMPAFCIEKNEWKVIDLVMKLCGCFYITLDEVSIHVKCLQ